MISNTNYKHSSQRWGKYGSWCTVFYQFEMFGLHALCVWSPNCKSFLKGKHCLIDPIVYDAYEVFIAM